MEIIVKSLYDSKSKPWGWELYAPVTVTLTTGAVIVIPKGFITDFATVPRLCRGVVSTIGNHNLATLIHDFLYVNKFSITDGRDWKKDRLFADREMYYWLQYCGASKFKALIIYWMVRLGGRSWWHKKY